jgi:hypothetical protein
MGTEMRKPLTKIKRLTLAGWRQNEIAERLGVHRNSVYRAQKKLGLQAWKGITPEEEKVILELLNAGHGTSWIGKELGCGEYQVRVVARKHGVRRQYRPGRYFHFHATAEQIMRITDLALSHRHSAKAIAKIVGVPYSTTKRICHQVLNCERFIGGTTKIGLDSYLPMKWREAFPKKAEDDTADKLRIVNYVLEACFGGQVPADPAQLIEVCTSVCLAVAQRNVSLQTEQWQTVREHFTAEFVQTVDLMRESRTAAWIN